MKLKSKKISQNQHKKAVQNLLQRFNINTKNPTTFTVNGCKVNLTGFQNQDTIVVYIDEEIDKVQCAGKRCDFVVQTKNTNILIEAKNGPMKPKAIKQLKNTQNWLQNQGIDSKNQILLAIAKDIPKPLFRQIKNEGVRHVKSGICIFKYLQEKSLLR